MVGIYDHTDESTTSATSSAQHQYVQVEEVAANASKDALYPELPEEACLVGTYPQPSGGLVSSMDDYFKFCQV